MKRCPICGSPRVLPRPCRYCHLQYCKKHASPKNHNCKNYHKRRRHFRIKLKSFSIWFVSYWVVIALYAYFEKALMQLPFFLVIHGLMYIFTITIALWSGYKLLKKCDYRAHSTLGIFGFKILSALMLIGGFALMLFAFFIGLSTVIVTANTLTLELLTTFLFFFSIAMMVGSAYLLFKFERKAGIIIFQK